MPDLFIKNFNEKESCGASQEQHELISLVSGLINKQAEMYSAMGNECRDRNTSSLLSEEYMTPWIVGYSSGLLDVVMQKDKNTISPAYEMLVMLFSAIYGEDKVVSAVAMYIACQEASSVNSFYKMPYEVFTSGRQTAFNEAFGGGAVTGLFRYLTSD